MIDLTHFSTPYQLSNQFKHYIMSTYSIFVEPKNIIKTTSAVQDNKSVSVRYIKTVLVNEDDIDERITQIVREDKKPKLFNLIIDCIANKQYSSIALIVNGCALALLKLDQTITGQIFVMHMS